MNDTPERPEPASSTSAENPAPAESPAPSPPPAPQAESAARNAEPAGAAPAPPAPPPAAATGDAAPAAAPDRATPATAPSAPSALPVPAAAPDRAPPRPSSAFIDRVKRVFNFETDVYPEVAADGQATFEAIVVVAVSSLLFGSFTSIALFFIVVPLSLVQTAISAGLVSIAAKLFNQESPGPAPWFRAMGYAEAPLALGLIPIVGSFVGVLYWIATGIAAIHRVARLPVGLAILTWVVAWLIPLVFLMFLVFLFGGLAFVGSMAGGLA